MSAFDRAVPRSRHRSAGTLVAVIAALTLLGATACKSAGTTTGAGGLTWASPVDTPPSVAPSPSATSSPSAPPTGPDTSTATGCVAATLSTMTLAEKAGQLVLIGTPVTDAASAIGTVGKYHVGGVFLQGRSTLSAASLRTAIASLQAAATSNGGPALQIAIDQEGGEVQTLTGPDFPVFPTAVEQGQWSAAKLKTQTVSWAKRLAGIGVTLDLAPVADTVPAGTEKSNPPIGGFKREYGSDPVAVAKDIATVVTAVQSAGVMTTLKHFPGLGRVKTNTDTGTGATDNVATTDDPYLGPFRSGIEAGTGAVMMSLASYPKLDSHTIAAFSKPIVTGLLRDQLGFTGLIISDDLGAAVAVSAVPMGERAVRFIEAGGDLALSVRTSDAKAMTAALIAHAKSSSAFAAMVSAAATKVLASKYQAGVLRCAPQP